MDQNVFYLGAYAEALRKDRTIIFSQNYNSSIKLVL